ncbi:FadR/GntR family transcriptional regulator [Patulibacter defluvii]|uniref:FadR/GntR family transcriptional regulator n=1 Tax=Patulibacter defluvii TaxID=3095358 RepID=UPI002A7637EE|nr:FadR/GntR family transcriptional regulator [Patulibacter sp. DM4]
MTDLTPVRRAPLYEEIAERLRDLIVVQRLEPGDRLPSERELASRLGVSRTSVRQALASLRSIGLVEVRHGDGAFLLRPADEVVPTLALEVLHVEADHPMVWEAREGIEVLAARLAATRATPADRAAMERAIEAMAAGIAEGDDGTSSDAALHRAIVDAAHNPLLAKLFEALGEAVDRTSAASLSIDGRPAESLRAHRAIVEAIVDRDPERAASEMTSHLRRSARQFTKPTPDGD